MNQWNEFKAACAELETWLRGRIKAHGIEYQCRPSGTPDSIEDLKAAEGLPVPAYVGRPDTIYSEGGCNKCLYQAYHDHFHKHGKPEWDFSYRGEYLLAVDHQDEARATGLSYDARRMLWVESWVRVAYHERWGRFPRNEALFHWLAWTVGYPMALEAEGV